jgi:hypothetical protein
MLSRSSSADNLEEEEEEEEEDDGPERRFPSSALDCFLNSSSPVF